jgi:hypothetical protein
MHEEDSRAGSAGGTASSTGRQFRRIPVYPPGAPHRAVDRLVGAPAAVLRLPARLVGAGVTRSALMDPAAVRGVR